VPLYRPNRQAHLISLKSKVRPLSQQPRRRLQRTALLDRALRRVARQHRTVTCLVHQTLRRRRVRRIRRIRLALKAHLEQRPLRVRRMHFIRRPRLRKRHPARRTRLVQTQRLDPRLSLVLKARLVRRPLPDRRLNPIPRVPPRRRNRLIRKYGHPSSEPADSTRRLVAPGYEPRRLAGGAKSYLLARRFYHLFMPHCARYVGGGEAMRRILPPGTVQN
jgi:hypothetical protein